VCPIKTADGQLSSIQGGFIDITRQKLLDQHREERLEEAIERKRQQEYFMDEIRNPLAATRAPSRARSRISCKRARSATTRAWP
jgi:hypothetical protein